MAKIGHFMKWDTTCRYKILGEVRMSPKGLILVFELDEAIMFSSQVEEYIDEETGETKKKKKDVKYYPEKYKGKIGMAYSDYEQTRQLNLFEDFTNYFQQDGTAVEQGEAEVVTEEVVQEATTIPVETPRQNYPIIVSGPRPADATQEVVVYGENKF